ncbi:predicted protein [Naegleria gruberi]|uniref:Predicted protein n=1 Tax=Naegleria gruberi TaxID=5762 RepID=D2V8Y5_NAEGR|nr:uncharacterized protein NAEGRDRAFT_65326 [Naegleria gruberi]EFC46772.1 predicted protein [Naegleria gruberi]|eukprot:XP_002679516.1 predicted protein [Naegleria gruberi strain NEG-M]
MIVSKQQQHSQTFSFKTKDHNQTDNASSMQFLPMIRSFFYGVITLSYSVTLYPFVRLFQWWFSIVKYLLFEIPKMITKKASQFMMRYQWFGNITLPIIKLIFVDLLRIPDKDVSNYLRIDVSRLRAQDTHKAKNVIDNITNKVTPVVNKVSDKVSSSVEKIIPKQLIPPTLQKIIVPEQEQSISKDQEKLQKQIDTLNLVISKQKSKIEKLQKSQDNKTKVDLEKLESMRKERDALVHEKNRLEHTTLTQLQMMQEVQVMLNNQAKKIHEFEALKENLNGQVHTLQSENQVLKTEILKEKERIRKFNSEFDRWNNLKQNLEDQIILLNRDLQSVNEDNLKLKEKNYSLEKGQKEHTQRLDAFEKIKHDFHDISIKLSQKEDEIDRLNDSVKDKTRENELLKNQVGDLDSELRKISLDYSKLKKQQSQVPQKSVQKQEQVIEKQQPVQSVTPKKDEIKEQRDKLGSVDKKDLPADAGSQEAAVMEMDSDRVSKSKIPEKSDKSKGVSKQAIPSEKQVEKKEPFYDKNLEKKKKTKVVEQVKPKVQAQQHHEKETYMTPSWEEETIIEANKPLTRRKSQQQLKEGEESQVYQVSDSYVEELNYMLDDIEKGEIENVQFQSIISNPKINGSLSKLDPEQVDDLLDVLEKSDNVSFVDFSNCGMDNSLTQKILHSLSKNNSIEVVDLATNCVEPNQLVDNVVEFIESNHACNKLLMKDWKFSDENLSKILHSIELKNKSIVDLKLDDSENSEENHKLLHQVIHNNILAK